MVINNILELKPVILFSANYQKVVDEYQNNEADKKFIKSNYNLKARNNMSELTSMRNIGKELESKLIRYIDENGNIEKR